MHIGQITESLIISDLVIVNMANKDFIQPVVITVKRYESVKCALDARALSFELVRDKYQMSNLEHLAGMVAEQLDRQNGRKGTAKHCIISR